LQDLSNLHEPITELFASNGHSVAEYRLSQEQVEHYRSRGFVTGIPVLTTEQVDALISELEALTDSAHPGHRLFYEFHANESNDPRRVLFHALGAWRISGYFHDLLWHPAVCVPASQLLHGAVRFWHDQLFCKPPRHGGVVAWHQDYSYWTRTEPMAHLSCFVALDDTSVENGCLYYVPGSHRWDLLPITGLVGDMHAIDRVLAARMKEQFKPIPIELRRGEACFHHPLLIHGSYENNTDRARRATVINMFRDGVRSATDSPLLEGVPVIPSGQQITGRFFPLLFDPDVQ